MDLFIAHSLILLWASVGTARRLVAGSLDRLVVAALLAWGNLVLAGLFLAAIGRMGYAGWLLGISGTLAIVTWAAAARLPPESLPIVPSTDSGPNRWLFSTLALSLLLLGGAAVMLAWTYPPNSHDAQTWLLPRALYYVGQHTLLPFSAADLRQTLQPFNVSLLHVMPLTYGAPLPCLHFFSLLAWLVTGAALYRCCRVLGIEANFSLIATGCVLTHAPMLAAVLVTTPVLPAAAATISALFLAARWRESRLHRHALLAALAAGLAAGSAFSAFAALLLVACGLQLFRAPAALPAARIRVLGGFIFGIGASAFVWINFVTDPTWPVRYLTWIFGQNASSASSTLWTTINPLSFSTGSVGVLNEYALGFGVSGWLLLGGGLLALGRDARTRLCTSLGLLWFLLTLATRPYLGFSLLDFLPAFVLLGPGLAANLAFLWTLCPIWRPILLAGFTLVIVAVSGVSGFYLLHNSAQPLRPLLKTAVAPPGLPSLPLLFEHHLSAQTFINVDTDGVDEAILPFMVHPSGRRQWFTSNWELEPAAYNLLSRAASAQHAGFAAPGGQSSYVLIAFPSKPSAGVEYLGALGQGPTARTYFGLEAQAGKQVSYATNRSLLVTLEHRPQPHIRVAGMNPQDEARLVVVAEHPDGRQEPIGHLDANGTLPLKMNVPFRQLLFRIVNRHDEVELLGIGAIPYHSKPVAVPASNSLPSPKLNSLFAVDIVLDRNLAPLQVEGLLPVEGPFPQWGLPLLRWARTPVVRIQLPPADKPVRLNLSFSTRLQVRLQAAMQVVLNGAPVKYFRIDDRMVWVDQELDLALPAGPNVLEFRDAAMEGQPDWLDYLERYPDVKQHVVTSGAALDQGARAHYETFGKQEGRLLNHASLPEPAPDGYYFMFRNIRVECFSMP